MLTLYFAPGSSSFAAHIALYEVGAPFERRPLSFAKKEQRAPAYLALNPEGKVPTLLIDGRPLTEVAGTLFYLAKTFPEAALLPSDAEGDAQAISFMSFIASTLHTRAQIRRRAYQEGLFHRRPPLGNERLGVGPLFHRGHPSLPALLAACRFAQARARHLAQSRCASRPHDGASSGA